MLSNLSTEVGIRTLQLVEALARQFGLLPPLPKDKPLVPTITKSIGTTGRDYSTIALWEADLDNSGIYASGDTAVGECYNDSAFNGDVLMNGGGTVGLTEVKLSVASGQRHTGIAGTGARMVRSAVSAAEIIDLNEGRNATIEWLEVSVTANGATTAVFLRTGASAKTHTAQRLIVHGVNRGQFGSAVTSGIKTGSATQSTYNVHNNIIYDVRSDQGGIVAGLYAAVGGTNVHTWQNNTCHNIINNHATATVKIIHNEDDADQTIKNTIATDPSGTTSGTKECYGISAPAAAVMSHNLASDTTASGTGSLDSKSSANQFVSTTSGSEDLHLKSGADAIDAGTDLVTTPPGVNFDIDNRDRDAQGDTWDMGADEFVAAAGAAVIVASLCLLGVGR